MSNTERNKKPNLYNIFLIHGASAAYGDEAEACLRRIFHMSAEAASECVQRCIDDGPQQVLRSTCEVIETKLQEAQDFMNIYSDRNPCIGTCGTDGSITFVYEKEGHTLRV